MNNMSKIFLQKAIFRNVAPVGDLDFELKENEVLSLTSINGKGKTTILSYIADAFFEIARKAEYDDVLEELERYYRIISPNSILDKGVGYSLVYLRFSVGDHHYDYVEVSGSLSEDEYKKIVPFEGKLDFGAKIKPHLDEGGSVKYIEIEKKNAKEILQGNVITYFPSDRAEVPVWLNDGQYKSVRLNTKTKFTSSLGKNIESRNLIAEVMSWILDVVLDQYVNESTSPALYHGAIRSKINEILQNVLSTKCTNPRVGISSRHQSSTRLGVYTDVPLADGTNKVVMVSPSFAHLSSGEISLVVLFSEIIKQYDFTASQRIVFDIKNISGIVLIDEIDKHLHIALQKEILPILINMFPNIQFIVSAHSPFFALGAEETLKERFVNFSLDFKKIIAGRSDGQLENVYVSLNEDYSRQKELMSALQTELASNKDETKPLIITEGKTDWKHLKKAKEKLAIDDCDVIFLEEPSDDKKGRGDNALFTLLDNHSQTPRTRKIIGIFDRDVPETIKKIEEKEGVKILYKDFGNNVFAFCIPVPENRKDYESISIEFYYPDENLKKENDKKCLYFENEINFDSKRTPTSKIDKPEDKNTKKIWDENIGSLDWIHSKARFAELVAGKIAGAENFANDFNFINFQLIFNKIKEIINPTVEQEANIE